MYYSTRYIASSFKACSTALVLSLFFYCKCSLAEPPGIRNSMSWLVCSYNNYEYSLLNKQHFIWLGFFYQYRKSLFSKYVIAIIFYMGVIIGFIVHSFVKGIVKALFYFEDVTFTNIHRIISFFNKDLLCCHSFFI